jgi:hypothetical protein
VSVLFLENERGKIKHGTKKNKRRKMVARFLL